VLRYFAIGLLPFAAFQLLRASFYARQDARTPAAVNVVENAVTIGLDFALFGLMHVQGLALAHSLGYVAGCAVAIVPLSRAIGGLEGPRVLAELAKVAAASGVMVVVMLLVTAGVKSGTNPGTGRDVLQLLAGGGAGLVAFVIAARVVRVRDLAFFRDLLPARFRRV
jgi:putative peptidoglycan lipid II flippase